jgi:hypothetical protein
MAMPIISSRKPMFFSKAARPTKSATWRSGPMSQARRKRMPLPGTNWLSGRPVGITRNGALTP